MAHGRPLGPRRYRQSAHRHGGERKRLRRGDGREVGGSTGRDCDLRDACACRGSSPMTTVDLLIVGGTLVTARTDGLVIDDAGIAIDGESIVDLGARTDIAARFQAATTMAADGMLIFPGLVDTHTHLYQTLLKGLGDDLPLMEWLDACTLPSIPHLTPRMCYVAAALGS